MSRYTFNPPDDELIYRYLNSKITGKDDLETESEINEVIICHHEPAEIPAMARMQSTHTWHVISRVEKLKGKCQRTKRSTKTGHWKITGKSSLVKDTDGNTIGFKKFLVFQESKKVSSSSSSSSSTGMQQNNSTWIIHEFHSFIQHPNKDVFVLCKLMKKTRAPRSTTVAEASPAGTDTIINPHQTTNDNNIVEDYGGEYFGGFEDINFPRFLSTDLLEQPHYSHNFAETTTESMEIDENWDGGSS